MISRDLSDTFKKYKLTFSNGILSLSISDNFAQLTALIFDLPNIIRAINPNYFLLQNWDCLPNLADPSERKNRDKIFRLLNFCLRSSIPRIHLFFGNLSDQNKAIIIDRVKLICGEISLENSSVNPSDVIPIVTCDSSKPNYLSDNAKIVTATGHAAEHDPAIPLLYLGDAYYETNRFQQALCLYLKAKSSAIDDTIFCQEIDSRIQDLIPATKRYFASFLPAFLPSDPNDRFNITITNDRFDTKIMRQFLLFVAQEKILTSSPTMQPRSTGTV